MAGPRKRAEARCPGKGRGARTAGIFDDFRARLRAFLEELDGPPDAEADDDEWDCPDDEWEDFEDKPAADDADDDDDPFDLDLD